MTLHSSGGTIHVQNVYPFDAADRRLLAGVSDCLDIHHGGEDTQAWVDALDDEDVEVLSASYAPADPGRFPRLRWIATAGAGLDDLLPRDPWSHSLVVTNGSGIHAVAMAEYVLAAALFASQRLAPRLANQRRRRWADVRHGLAGRRLRGRTAAIIGYGSIGRETARLLAACGMGIIAVKARPDALAEHGWREPGTGDPDGRIPERVVGIDQLETAVAVADLVVLALPLTLSTRGVFDQAAINALRSTAVVVNVGRGATLDEGALIAAVRAGRVEQAFLDVFSDEPLAPDSDAWADDRIVVTPHVSGIGDLDATWHNMALLLADNLHRYVVGEPMVNLTDGAAGY